VVEITPVNHHAFGSLDHDYPCSGGAEIATATGRVRPEIVGGSMRESESVKSHVAD
jgi:hypothetical protein